MKFIADSMLGRLAKRLRLLGFDVLYDTALDDTEIIRISLQQQRLILTRDTGLASRPLARRHLLLRSYRVQEQIDEVLQNLSLRSDVRQLSRCSACNGMLRPLAKKDARDLVPNFVYDHYDAFTRCEMCERIYWKGSHVKRMGLEKNSKRRSGAG